MKVNRKLSDEQLDRMLKQAILPPGNLAESIQLAIHNNAKEKIPSFHWWYNKKILSLVTASAALVVAILAVSVLLSQHPSTNAMTATTDKTSHKEAHMTQHDDNLDTTIPQVLDYVSTTSSKPGVSNAHAQKSTLDDSVVHTWYVNDLAKFQKALSTFATQNNLTISFGAENNTAKLKLSDRQLQTLVNTLENSQARLFDQQLPRPHQERSVNFTGKAITYFCSFVKE